MNADRDTPRAPALGLDERLVLGHVGALLVFLPWAFGGQIGWAREIATVWSLGVGGALLLRLVWRHDAGRAAAAREHLRRLWPLLALAALGATALAFPTFIAGRTEFGPMLIEQPQPRWLPVCAQPTVAARELALSVGLVLTAFNLLLGVHHRRALRGLAALIALNAGVLATMGALQKLLGQSLYFGAVVSPNPSCFATFIYHNHWVAYALLGFAAGAALLLQRRAPDEESRWNRRPTLPLAAGLMLLAATLPLCASRSGTALGVLLGGAVLVTATVRAARRDPRRSAQWYAAAVAVAAFVAVGAGFLAKPFFERRVTQTASQFDRILAGEFSGIDDRVPVYRATAAMIADRPWFGWGAGSYGAVFQLYRRPETEGLHFAHAHSDWLQAAAERGGVGVALVVGLLGGALVRLRWRGLPAFSAWLLAGTGLIGLYAAVEFPFENPAVAATWWTLWVVALRYRRLTPQPTAGTRA